MAIQKVKARFIEPMLLLRSSALPEGSEWLIELKLDGYRAVAFKTGGKVHLRSRNNNDFSGRYSTIAKALADMPDETVIDGEIVALDESGRPSFNSLQNFGSSKVAIVYYAFDVMILCGVDVMQQELTKRRELLYEYVLSQLSEPIRLSPELEGSMADLVQSVKAQKLEGLIAKRRNSIYTPGDRGGVWRKMRINDGQEFVIAGYTVAGNSFDALVFGYYDSGKLIYVARTRNGFTPQLREQLLKRFLPLRTDVCPFSNLPEAKSGRWGVGLTAAKMADCRWLRPELVGQFEFTEWTPDNHLRHSRFASLRDDKRPESVTREWP